MTVEGAEPSLLPMLCGGLFFRYASQKNKALLMIFSVWTCFNSSLTVRLKRFSEASLGKGYHVQISVSSCFIQVAAN